MTQALCSCLRPAQQMDKNPHSGQMSHKLNKNRSHYLLSCRLKSSLCLFIILYCTSLPRKHRLPIMCSYSVYIVSCCCYSRTMTLAACQLLSVKHKHTPEKLCDIVQRSSMVLIRKAKLLTILHDNNTTWVDFIIYKMMLFQKILVGIWFMKYLLMLHDLF